MDEFLFEESLLESMEILSFEERDINEIVRENAHALLDAEMDMEELLCESGLELVEEGFVNNVKAKIKALFNKIKELIRKFIEWIKSLFKKKEEAINNASNEKSASTSGNSNEKSASTSGNSNKRLGSGVSSNGGNTESKTNEKWKSVRVELLNIDKLAKLCYSLYDEMQENASVNVNASIDEEVKVTKEALERSYSQMENQIGYCWEETGVEKIITVKDGKFQYESINKKLLEVLERCQKFVQTFESDMDRKISQLKNEYDENVLWSLTQVIVGLLNKHLALLKSVYNKDMTNRQRAFVEVRRIKKEGK